MRICLVTREYAHVTSYSGGIGTQFATLAPELAQQGHDTHVIVPASQSTSVPGGSRDGVRFHPVPRPGLGWSFGVRDAIAELGRFDVVFAPEWGGDAWPYSRGSARGRLVTNLTTSLDQILALNREWRRGPKLRFAHAVQSFRERSQTERSDALIACSHAIQRWSGELWNLNGLPSAVIPNMVDLMRIRALANTDSALPAGLGRPVVGYSGRLEIRKGVHVLVAAMHAVWDAFPDAELVLCGADSAWGSGTMSDHLVKLAGSRANRLRILGPLPPGRLYATLRGSDVVALPSLWENFALAGLEVLTLGIPLVATTGGGFVEMVEEGVSGVLVPPADSGALSSALLRLLGDDTARKRLAVAGALRAERFDKTPVTAAHIAFFELVAGGRC